MPKNTVPISSVGPVPPAVAADSPAAAESPAPEDGDQSLLNFSPLTTVTSLEYQGLATIFLCPVGPENQQFSSPCHLPDIADPSPQWSSSLARWRCRGGTSVPSLLSALLAGGVDLLTRADLRRGNPLGRLFQPVSQSGGVIELL